MTANRRVVAVPDTDGELVARVGALEELLGSLVRFDDDPEKWDPPPPPLGDGTALAALRRVSSELVAAERCPVTQPIAPDGRFELVPVRFVTLEAGDLAVIAQALALVGRAALPGGDELVADAVAEHAAARGQTSAELVASVARAHGLLDLAPDTDTAALPERLGGQAGSIVLTSAELAAYERLTTRFLAMFHAGDSLARFIYRGASPQGRGLPWDQLRAVELDPEEVHKLLTVLHGARNVLADALPTADPIAQATRHAILDALGGWEDELERRARKGEGGQRRPL